MQTWFIICLIKLKLIYDSIFSALMMHYNLSQCLPVPAYVWWWTGYKGQLSLPFLRGRWMSTGWTRGVQVKLKSLENGCHTECLRSVFTTRRYTNPHLPYLTFVLNCIVLCCYWLWI